MNPELFNSIYNNCYKKVFLFTKSYVNDEEIARDIVSEGFLKLWQTEKSEDQNWEALIFIIIRNKALDYLKHELIRINARDNLYLNKTNEMNLRIRSLEECDPKYIFSQEIKTILHSTLRTLPQKTQVIFMMSRFQNKNNHEISKALNLSDKSIEYHLSKALKILRIALKDYVGLFL